MGLQGGIPVMASDIGFVPTGSVGSTNTQDAIAEVSGDVTALAASVAGTIAALTASDIAFTPTGTVSATDVQSAVAEVSGDVTTLESDLASNGTGKGAEMIGYIAPFTGAMATTQDKKNAQTVDLEDFGTVDKTGSVSCTAVFNLAKTGLGVYGGVIHFPKGTLKGHFVLDGAPIKIEGKGKRSTTLIPSVDDPVIAIGSMSASMVDCCISDLGIINTGAVAIGTTPAIHFIGTGQINDNHILKNIFIQGFPYGILINGRCILPQFEGVECYLSGINGYRIEPIADASVNHLKFVNCRSYVSKSHGMYFKSYGSGTAPTIIGINLDHCDIERAGWDTVGSFNTTNSIAGIWSDGVEGLTIGNECYFESNGDHAADSLGANIRITGSFNQWFRISNCLLWACQNAIKIDAVLSIGYIGECRLAGSVSTLAIAVGTGSDIVVGPNYDTGTHLITANGLLQTFVSFLSPKSGPVITTTLTDGMSARGLNYIFATNGTPLTINTIIDGEMGQDLEITTGAGVITFPHSGTSANGFFFHTQANHAAQPYSTLRFKRTVGFRGWVCTSISAKTYGLTQLVAGTVTIVDTTITASTPVIAAVQISGGTRGNLSVSLNAGVGFTISSTSVTETSWVAWTRMG